MNKLINKNRYEDKNQEIGRFFVIEGIDGSGKTTQIKILKHKLESFGYKVLIADFPQYNHKSAGAIEEYLSGKYGELEEVNPYAASCFYAIDRFDASSKIKKWIQQGFIVLANRYIHSNMAHQGSKIKNSLERQSFYEWIENLEYKIFKIPKPDKIFLLNLNPELAQHRSKKRHRIDWEGKVRDIHEENINHLKESQKTFLEIQSKYPRIELINYEQNGRILEKEEINKILFNQIKNQLHKNRFPNFLNAKKFEENKKNTLKIKNQTKIKSLESLIIKPQEQIKLKTNILIKHSNNLKFIIPNKNLLENNISLENNFIRPDFKGQLEIYLRNNGNNNFQIFRGNFLANIYWEE